EGRYIGSLLTDTTSTPNVAYGQGSLVVVGASAGYEIARGWDIDASVTNALDRDYSENAYAVAQPFNRTLSPPRTIAVGLRWSF
ncbi:TonB-dependent receptor, partial [bacterium]